MDEPFSVALRLSLDIAESGARSMAGPGWRDGLRPVLSRELGSRVWSDESRPSRDQADRLVGQTLTNHPSVNLTAAKRLELSNLPHALVIAEIVLRPELAPIPPGGVFPDITDEILSEPIPFHVAVWPFEAGSAGEQEAAAEILQDVVAELPQEMWRRDG